MGEKHSPWPCITRSWGENILPMRLGLGFLTLPHYCTLLSMNLGFIP